ncbi:hypothetical protein UF75_3138 [Desulfosporosinus sp. I2]|nr:hypothetical protein UF75_3138 [Desulfosporosinus sp. I2]
MSPAGAGSIPTSDIIESLDPQEIGGARLLIILRVINL